MIFLNEREIFSFFGVKTLFTRALETWNRIFPPFFNEDSTVRRLLRHYPQAHDWLKERYGMLERDIRRSAPMTLRELSLHFQLPPPQILFLEIQMSSKWKGIAFVDAKLAQHLLAEHPNTLILDARDAWEKEVADIHGAQLLNEESLSHLARSSERTTPVLLFCHFGVRSTDFAVRLKEWGYEKVWVMKGGIDAWAQSVDPTMKRYEGSWC